MTTEKLRRWLWGKWSLRRINLNSDPPLVGSTLCVKSRGGKYAATVKDVIEEVRVECCIIHWHIVNFDIYRQILQTTRGSWYVRYIIICLASVYGYSD